VTDDDAGHDAGPSGVGAAPDGPVPAIDLYAVLGIRPEATHGEIVEAVEALDRRLRTAAARDRPGAGARLKRLNTARHWLADGTRRRRYDAAIAAAGGPVAGRLRSGGTGPDEAGLGRGAGEGWNMVRLGAWAAIAAIIVVIVLILGNTGGSPGPVASGSSLARPTSRIHPSPAPSS
jgi:hypothetical protein